MYRRDLNSCTTCFKAGFAICFADPAFFVCSFYEFFINKVVSPEFWGKPLFLLERSFGGDIYKRSESTPFNTFDEEVC